MTKRFTVYCNTYDLEEITGSFGIEISPAALAAFVLNHPEFDAREGARHVVVHPIVPSFDDSGEEKGRKSGSDTEPLGYEVRVNAVNIGTVPGEAEQLCEMARILKGDAIRTIKEAEMKRVVVEIDEPAPPMASVG
ncbi:MAG: hypothetical protein IJS96_01050 [Schwartzia sp.]|nr:hypothetical protein [Schwartzia sp. (in: firmicutes)]